RFGRLHADHLEVWIDRLGHDAGPGGAAPATDRHDDHLDVRLPLEHLERLRSDPGNQVRLVTGMDVSVAVLLGPLGGLLARLIEIDTVRDDLSAEAPNRAHLDRADRKRTRLNS